MLGVQSFTHASIATTRKDASQSVSEASFDSACRCDRHNFKVQNQIYSERYSSIAHVGFGSVFYQ
jgi:hypothetical protein